MRRTSFQKRRCNPRTTSILSSMYSRSRKSSSTVGSRFHKLPSLFCTRRKRRPFWQEPRSRLRRWGLNHLARSTHSPWMTIRTWCLRCTSLKPLSSRTLRSSTNTHKCRPMQPRARVRRVRRRPQARRVHTLQRRKAYASRSVALSRRGERLLELRMSTSHKSCMGTGTNLRHVKQSKPDSPPFRQRRILLSGYGVDSTPSILLSAIKYLLVYGTPRLILIPLLR